MIKKSLVYFRIEVCVDVDHRTVIVSPVRSTYGGYYGLVVVTRPRPRPRPHFIVYAITLKNLIGLLPYFICRLI